MAQIAIIGTGFIGRGWAIAHARAGNLVTLWDQDPEAGARAKSYISGVLPDLAANGLLPETTPEAVLDRISVASTLEAAVSGADYVQENTYEDLAIKRDIFKRLDAAARPDAVLASSTSAILPSAFTEDLPGRARCIVVHPLNPPYVLPAVELIPAPWTDPKITEAAAEVMRGIGQNPIVMAKELDGFIVNRLQGALLQEAFRLVAGGYASAEDVDIAIKDGLALRWSFMGPFETIDLNAPAGVRDYVERYEGMYINLWSSQTERADWGGETLNQIEASRRERLGQDQLQERQAWRDRRLMALLAHKAAADRDIGK